MVSEKSDSSIDRIKTVGDAIRWAEGRLRAARVYFGHGTDNPLDEAAWLVGGALRITPEALTRRHRRELGAAARRRLAGLMERRVTTRQPTAYLLNEAWFCGRRFYVDQRVIVPRSLIGEFIPRRFQPWVNPSRVRRILDLCTGSGCIAIACAHAFPDAHVDATDISNDALAVARVNIARHRVGARVHLFRSDLFSRLHGRRYDLIVTNPPYVGRAEMRRLPKEYRHEPALALASGANGLDAVTRILRDAGDHLEPHGVLLAEVGNSGPALQARFPRMPFLWLTAGGVGDDGVFLLTARQLATADFRHRGRSERTAPRRRVRGAS